MSEGLDLELIGKSVRKSRVERGIKNLEEFADRVAERGVKRPSTAKLSRIETGEQPVPMDILPALSDVTGISTRDLRPDLANLMDREGIQ